MRGGPRAGPSQPGERLPPTRCPSASPRCAAARRWTAGCSGPTRRSTRPRTPAATASSSPPTERDGPAVRPAGREAADVTAPERGVLDVDARASILAPQRSRAGRTLRIFPGEPVDRGCAGQPVGQPPAAAAPEATGRRLHPSAETRARIARPRPFAGPPSDEPQRAQPGRAARPVGRSDHGQHDRLSVPRAGVQPAGRARRPLRGAGGLRAPHAGLDVRVRGHGGGARAPGDHRRRGRRGAPARHGRREDPACPVLGVPVPATVLNGRRRAPVDRPDAQGRARRHAGHRQAGRANAGAARRRRSSACRRPEVRERLRAWRAARTATCDRRSAQPSS